MCGYLQWIPSVRATGRSANRAKDPTREKGGKVLPQILKFAADTEAALFLFDETVAEYLTWIFLDSPPHRSSGTK